MTTMSKFTFKFSRGTTLLKLVVPDSPYGEPPVRSSFQLFPSARHALAEATILNVFLDLTRHPCRQVGWDLLPTIGFNAGTTHMRHAI